MSSDGATSSDRARLQAELEARLRFETLLADISAKLIHLPAAEVDRQIEDAQRLVCESLDLDLSALWQWRPENPSLLTLTHLFRPLGGPPPPDPMDADAYFPWCQRQVLAGKTVVVSSMAELPPEAARDREVWTHYGIKTTLTIPLSAGGSPVFGCVSFNDMRSEREWAEPLVQRLRLVAQIFANALARKVAEIALRESEARLSLAADSAGVGLWSLDLASNRFWMTAQTRGLFLYPEDEVVTWDRFLALVHPQDRELLERELQHVVQSGRECRVEYRSLRPDGGVRWMVSRGRFHRTGPEASPCVMGVTVDTTDRKLAELALREKEERLAAAVEIAALGFYEFDGEDRRVFLDDRIRSMLGMAEPRGSEIWQLWAERLHPGDREPVLDLSRQMLSGSLQGAVTEYRYLHPQRGLLWLRHASRVFSRDAQGRPLRILGVMQDVTERKRAEQQIEQQRNQLSHLSRVNLLGELAGSLAHELNQPLTAVLSNAQAAQRFLAQDPPDLNEVRDILADIVAEDKHAGEVIRRLRLLLKTGQVQYQPLDVKEIVQEVLKLVRNDLVIHNFTVRTVLAPRLPLIRGDRVQLQQVLLNLVMNACDAMADTTQGERRITIRIEQDAAETIRVAITDCGVGIAAEPVDQVFEPFYTTKPHGLGLGLAVCRTIVTAHGGRLWATNNPECGATFHVSLPVAEASPV